MNKKETFQKLTNFQIGILEALRDGEMITIDRQNMPYLGSRLIQPQTRYFLTENKLITRLDKSKSIETKGNGFTISKKGLLWLEKAVPPKKKIGLERKTQAKRLPRNSPPTESQLSYARDLGLEVPDKATMAEVSDILSTHLEGDEAATDLLRSFAEIYGIDHTRFTGKRSIFERIQNVLKTPERDQELAAWFVYCVYRDLVKGADNDFAKAPNDSRIKEIAEQLSKDKAVMQSIRKYNGRDLMQFGEWTSPDGLIHSGGSNLTTAFKKASAILKDRIAMSGKGTPGKCDPGDNLFSVHRRTGKSESKEKLQKSKIRNQGKGGCLSVVFFAGIIIAGIAMVLIKS